MRSASRFFYFQAEGPRSKTVILVKNLPSGTKSSELHQVFSKHGTVGRVILPPSGITAIVEFLESTEAKLAYKKLAYTKVISYTVYTRLHKRLHLLKYSMDVKLLDIHVHWNENCKPSYVLLFFH